MVLEHRQSRDTRGEKESGELVSSCSSRSDNDGAVLPSTATGKLQLLSINNFVHMSRTARPELDKQEIINDIVSLV